MILMAMAAAFSVVYIIGQISKNPKKPKHKGKDISASGTPESTSSSTDTTSQETPNDTGQICDENILPVTDKASQIDESTPLKYLADSPAQEKDISPKKRRFHLRDIWTRYRSLYIEEESTNLDELKDIWEKGDVHNTMDFCSSTASAAVNQDLEEASSQIDEKISERPVKSPEEDKNVQWPDSPIKEGTPPTKRRPKLREILTRLSRRILYIEEESTAPLDELKNIWEKGNVHNTKFDDSITASAAVNQDPVNTRSLSERGHPKKSIASQLDENTMSERYMKSPQQHRKSEAEAPKKRTIADLVSIWSKKRVVSVK